VCLPNPLSDVDVIVLSVVWRLLSIASLLPSLDIAPLVLLFFFFPIFGFGDYVFSHHGIFGSPNYFQSISFFWRHARHAGAMQPPRISFSV